MRSTATAVTVSRKALWAGRIISAWVVAFLVFDAVAKILRSPAAVEGTIRLGYPENLVVVIGIVELICIALYLIPRTVILGAILLTGYLGGGTATQGRVTDPWFALPVAVAVMVWAGIALRDNRLRALIVQRTSEYL